MDSLPLIQRDTVPNVDQSSMHEWDNLVMSAKIDRWETLPSQTMSFWDSAQVDHIS